MHRLKVEILIPKRYNNREIIETDKHRITYLEIFNEFGGCTMDNSPLIGVWRNPKTGKKYNDRSFSYWVICNDDYKTIAFLYNYKKVLKERYEQDDIMIYSLLINEIE